MSGGKSGLAGHRQPAREAAEPVGRSVSQAEPLARME